MSEEEDTLYVFHEPHMTGGHATIEITRAQIVKFMREAFPEWSCTDEEALQEFVAVNWATKKAD